MRAVSSYASAIVTAAMMASASGAYAQDSKLSVPNVTVHRARRPGRAALHARPVESLREKCLLAVCGGWGNA